MKPSEFTSFEDELPYDNKWLIVTNNINETNAYGEMCYVWLVNFVMGQKDGSVAAFDPDGQKIKSLTHWKYA